MQMTSNDIKKINILNSIFTQNDFSFLDSLDEEIKLIENQIQNQDIKREFILKATNYFEQNIKNIDKNNINTINDLLNEINNTFTIVNSNKKSLFRLKDLLTTINTNIINLLVNIEAHPDSPNTYMDQVNALKINISQYLSYSDTTKAEIANNDLTINTFLRSYRFRKLYNEPFFDRFFIPS